MHPQLLEHVSDGDGHSVLKIFTPKIKMFLKRTLTIMSYVATRQPIRFLGDIIIF